MNNTSYIYTWGNNPKRAILKGHNCKIIARGALNSCVIEFENGQQEVVSRNALRKLNILEGMWINEQRNTSYS